MDLLVTCGTRGDEIVFRIRPAMAAIYDVVDLQVGSGAAELAAPVVAFEDLESQKGTFGSGELC
jgi:hypothetical protein